MEAYLFLIALVFIGVIAQNKSLIIAAAFLLIIKAIGLDGRLFPSLQAKGITWGVTLITAAILVPFGDISASSHFYQEFLLQSSRHTVLD